MDDASASSIVDACSRACSTDAAGGGVSAASASASTSSTSSVGCSGAACVASGVASGVTSGCFVFGSSLSSETSDGAARSVSFVAGRSGSAAFGSGGASFSFSFSFSPSAFSLPNHDLKKPSFLSSGTFLSSESVDAGSNPGASPLASTASGSPAPSGSFSDAVVSAGAASASSTPFFSNAASGGGPRCSDPCSAFGSSGSRTAAVSGSDPPAGSGSAVRSGSADAPSSVTSAGS